MGLLSRLFSSVDSKKISDEGIRIDVRTKEECCSGMIGGAKNIPLEALCTQIHKIAKDKNQLIGVYCASGMRSGMAKRRLKTIGYTNVINEGGYSAVKRRLSE